MGFFDFIPIVGPVVSAVTGAISNDSNNKAIKEENAKQRQFSHDEAILAHNRQLEIMDKQNDWNSYTNQRRLLTDAGYNPNALFNSSSTLSASSGASGGAQASAPSIGMPNPTRFDIGTLSDAALKMSQAKNIDADTKKKEAEAKGQDLQNSYQEVVNKFQESNIKLDMDKKDSERALNDAQRLATHTSQMLDFDELHNLRPVEVAKRIAETNSSNSSAALSRIQAAKTDKERELLVKQYYLQLMVANATVANLYAQKAYTDTQRSLWEPGGVLYNGSKADSDLKGLNYKVKKDLFDATFDEFRYNLKKQLITIGVYNDKINEMLNDGKSLNYIKFLNCIPGVGVDLQPVNIPYLW